MTCTRPEEASGDDDVEAALSEAVQGGSGAAVGQPLVGRIGDEAGEVSDVGTDPEADGEVLISVRMAVDEGGGAGGADDGGTDAADVIESRVDVDRLGLGKVLVIGRAPVGKSPQTTRGEAIGRKSGSGGAAGDDAGAAMIVAGSRADWTGLRPG